MPKLQPYECHEGNDGLVNMLEIARSGDRARPATATNGAGRR